MSLVYKKPSQIQRLLRKFEKVNGGAFILKLGLLGLIPFFFLFADDVTPSATPELGAEVIDTNATISPTDTNATISPTDTNATSMPFLPKERQIPATLGQFSVIPRKDPFRLIKPKREEPKPEIVTPPRTVGVPQLSGISTMFGTNKAVLRISPPSGGKAEYVFLKEGEELHGVEVVKIKTLEKDANMTKTLGLPEWTVEVLVRGQTFNLELDKKRVVSSRSGSSRSSRSSRSSSSRPSGPSTSPVRPSGNNYRPNFGRETQKPTTSPEKKLPPSTKGGSTPKPPGNQLKQVPTRERSIQPSLEFPSRFGAEMYEEPPFDLSLQQLITDPAQLTTQREIIRGQYSQEVPTDLPVKER